MNIVSSGLKGPKTKNSNDDFDKLPVFSQFLAIKPEAQLGTICFLISSFESQQLAFFWT